MTGTQEVELSPDGAREDKAYASLTPAVSRDLKDVVVERLREAILRGDFVPGQALREVRLASTLEVSRGPVREALKRLEREGLVLIRRNRGATVARLSDDDLEEVYALRIALEEVAGRWAVRNATESDFSAIQSVLDELKRAVARGMYEQEYAKLDIEFHDRMYQAAHHERLYRCWAELRPQVYVLLLSGNAMRHNFSKTAVSHHKPLLDVLRSCDEELAAAIVRRHVEDSYFLVKTGRYPRREPDDIYEVLIRQAEAQ